MPAIPQPLQNEDDYVAALQRLQKLMHAQPKTKDAEELVRYADLVESYENLHCPIAIDD